jgi:type I site-specific restriction endonuclease
MPAEKRTPESTYNAMVEALLNGQRRTVAHLETLATRVDELTGEMVKFSRNQIQLRSDVGEIRGEISELRADVNRRFEAIDRRFDAILVRLDELDATADKNADDIRKMRIELVSQYNDILNALQSGHQAKLDIDEINARLDELERRAGLR